MGDLTAHFSKKEFACPCCGRDDIDKKFVERLESARRLAGVAFRINSGVRCLEHNKRVGGVDSSAHVLGVAADIKVSTSHRRFKIRDALLGAGFTRFGSAKNFIHVDCDETKDQEVEWMY